MMATILATLDGSEESMAIMPVLARTASALDADVELVTVVKPAHPTADRVPTSLTELGPPSGPGPAVVYQESSEGVWGESPSQAIERVDQEARDSMRGAKKTLEGAGLRVSEKVLSDNDAARAIVDYAGSKQFDMIAMATHGRTGLRKAIQGSVAASVVASGVAPVLLVRPKAA